MHALAIALLLATAAPATAQTLTARDGGPLIAWYLAENATVEKTADNWGDPLLSVSQYGRDFQVYFYGCTGGAACTAIQFYSGYQTTGAVRQATINDWNARHRYLRAYLSEDGNANVEFDVFLGQDGLSPDDFAQLNALWLAGMQQFEGHIGW